MAAAPAMGAAAFSRRWESENREKAGFIWKETKKAVPLHRFFIGDSLAQLVEHNTFNVGVWGSSPQRVTSLKVCN